MPDSLGVTGNAILLLAFIAARLDRVRPDDPYELVDVDSEAGLQVIRHRLTGNTFSVSVEQIGGEQ